MVGCRPGARLKFLASAWIPVVRFCCFRGLLFRSGGGAGLITSSLHTSHGTGYEFLGIYRLWRVFSLKVVVFDGGQKTMRREVFAFLRGKDTSEYSKYPSPPGSF